MLSEDERDGYMKNSRSVSSCSAGLTWLRQGMLMCFPNLAFITLPCTLDCHTCHIRRSIICESQDHVLIVRPQWFMWFSVLRKLSPDIVVDEGLGNRDLIH